MRRIIDLFNKLCVYLFCVYRIVFKSIFKKKDYEKNILVVSIQHLGESVLFIDCMNYLLREYTKKGYEVTYIGNKSTVYFYKEYLEYQPSSYIAVDEEYKIISGTVVFFEFYRLCRLLDKKSFSLVLVPFDSIMTIAITSAIFNRKSVGLTNRCGEYKEANILLRYIWRNYATERVYFDDAEMMLERYAHLMKALGMVNYESMIGRIIAKEKYCPKEGKKYFVLVPGAMERARRWGAIKYADVIGNLIIKFDLNCVIVGMKEEIDVSEEILEHSIHWDGEIINLVGKTNISEMVDVLAGAEFIVGNDTGTIHIGASLGIQTFAITTYKDPGVYLPYIIKKERIDDKFPCVIRLDRRPECSGCHAFTGNDIRQDWRIPNIRCKEDVSSGKPYSCIGLIREEQVLKIIEDKIDKQQTLVSKNY